MMSNFDVIIISRKDSENLNSQLKQLGNHPKLITEDDCFKYCFKRLKYPFNFKIIIVPELDWEKAAEDNILLGAKLVEEIRLDYACIAPIAFVSFLKKEQVKAHIPSHVDNSLVSGENFYRLPHQGLIDNLKKKFINIENHREYAKKILVKLVERENINSTDGHIGTLQSNVGKLWGKYQNKECIDTIPVHFQYLCLINCIKTLDTRIQYNQDLIKKLQKPNLGFYNFIGVIHELYDLFQNLKSRY